MKLSQKQAAELIGRPVRWLRESICPRKPDGSYESAAVAQWYLSNETASLQELENRKSELEVEVLTVRSSKMSQENGLASGDLMRMADFFASGIQIADPFRKAGDLFARGVKFSGPDAAAIVSRACIDAKRIIEHELSTTLSTKD